MLHMEMTVGVRKINVLYTRITDGQMESVTTLKPLRNPREPLLTGRGRPITDVSSTVQLNDAAAGKSGPPSSTQLCFTALLTSLLIHLTTGLRVGL